MGDHREQFVQFRVSVYRLKIPGNPKISSGGLRFGINDLLSSSFSDTLFQQVSEAANSPAESIKDSKFIAFMGQFYGHIDKALMSGARAKTSSELIDDGVFVEMDATPLVLGFSSTASLDDMNTCTITTVNPRDVTVSDPELDAYKRNSFSFLSSIAASSPSATKASADEFKQGPPFRLFDLVRVWLYARKEKPLARLASLKKGAMISAEKANLRPEEFLFRPVFTGVVTEIEESNTASESSMINIRCASLKRMMTQSVTVFSDALAPVITTAAPELGILSGKFTSLDNVFNNMNGDDVVKKLYLDYFSGRVLRPSDTSIGPVTSLIVPNIASITERMFDSREVTVGDKKIPICFNLIPMLPTIILMHILKLRYREPILTWDDRLGGPRSSMSGGIPELGRVDIPMSLSAQVFGYSARVRPYLTRIRSSFSNFDSSYSSAQEVLDQLKNTSYLELFEDKTGSFHFRFPRYNDSTIDHNIDLSEMVSARIRESDTAVFSAATAQRMIDFLGSTGSLDGRVFIDKVATLFYGFRRPQTLENANATDTLFATSLARFIRDYKVGRELLVASIGIIGHPDIEPGDMVTFRTARRLRGGRDIVEKGSGTASGVRAYCGYVISVNDNVRVSGQYSQTVELAFVREANVTSGANGSPRFGKLWDAVDINAQVTKSKTSLGVHSPSTIPSELLLGSKPKADSDFLVLFSGVGEYSAHASARYIRSSVDLATFAAKPKSVKESSFVAAANNVDPYQKTTSSEYMETIVAHGEEMRNEVIRLATLQVAVEILSEAKGTIKAIRDKMTTTTFTVKAGIDTSLPGSPVFQEIRGPTITTKPGFIKSHIAMEERINRENIRRFEKEAKVPVRLEGMPNATFIFIPKPGGTDKIVFSAKVGAGNEIKKAIPELDMGWVLLQVKSFSSNNSKIKERYEKLFLSPAGGISTDEKTMRNDSIKEGASILDEVLRWMDLAIASGRRAISEDQSIQKIHSDIKEAEIEMAAAKNESAVASNKASLAKAKNPALAKIAGGGADASAASLAHSGFVPADQPQC